MIAAATARGLHDLETGAVELPDQDVRFATARDGERWALVDHGRTLLASETRNGTWQEVARLEEASGLVLLPLGAHRCLVGTEGAHVLCADAEGIHRLLSFDDVPGRDAWYNPAASGRPDVWSFAATGDAIFCSVHVGGLWRSEDLCDTWENALEPEVDVHQVATADGLVFVAAEGGFAVSQDLGRSWTWTSEGLHANYLQSVTLAAGSVFVGASSGPFNNDAAVYRTGLTGSAFERRTAGLPQKLQPIGPHHLVGDGPCLAVAEWNSSDVYASHDEGRSWARVASDLPHIRSLAHV
jgi:photosystem II stability/assembly factor-like uncharacterized protein